LMELFLVEIGTGVGNISNIIVLAVHHGEHVGALFTALPVSHSFGERERLEAICNVRLDKAVPLLCRDLCPVWDIGANVTDLRERE